MSEEKSPKKKSISEKEHDTLRFWRENNIFEKSLEKNDPQNSFVFYDGPPFATGLPHYGHLLQGAIKDVIPRYHTMNGKYVRRVWGWDCHGLPIENLIEAELGLNSKKEIEEYGIREFNERARESVLRYDKEWRKFVPRFGRWIDMDNPYKTMDPEYTESVWWAFKTLHDKELVYQGYKAMHICPRCETTLASSEVALGYKEVKDLSVTAKFELLDEPGTFVLAWTTTAWTLPGNVALAVNPDVTYVKCDLGEEAVIVAKALSESVLKEKDYQVLDESSGKDLIGKSYKPLFEYYAKDEKLENSENGWKIYGADFVQTEGGTGIVHIAPAFGEDDLELGRRENLPFVQHVKMNGVFKPEVTDFAGMTVKQKGDTQSTDIEIIKKLAHDGLLFAKEKITHSYPLCWRCDTPLLNYAASSWFVEVSGMREKLVSENENIHWVPEKTGTNRFGNWLKGARDWAISRSRYWGAPIPVWKCGDCKEMEVIGSLEDLQQKQGVQASSFFVMRHGEAESNVADTVSSDITDENHITETGKKQVKEAVSGLKEKNIDVIVSSDIYRTKETAERAAKELGLEDQLVFDERLREINFGELNGESRENYHGFFEDDEDRYYKAPEGGENLFDVKRRVMEFLFEAAEKYQGKNVLIVSHQDPSWMMLTGYKGKQNETIMREGKEAYALHNAEVREFVFAPFPHNDKYELDFHRPYIDEAVFPCGCGGEMKRVPEVFDCWFESGSMPYGQFHYPFENEEVFQQNFPANFIAEAVDQTRGWFYNMLVLSVGLFGKSAFQNVITTGLVLAEDGQKMSKKLKNYPDPLEVAEKYGADAVRYYMLASPIVRGEELLFSEKGVDEVSKKVMNRLGNVLSFYELYAGEAQNGFNAKESKNVLDRWILTRFQELLREVDEYMDIYEIDRAVRPIADFIDDLSTWYLRRSRDRFKVHSAVGGGNDETDKQYALAALRFVLLELSKTMAPFMPFMTEDVYARVGGEKESVHLEDWPKQETNIDTEIIKNMKEVRALVTMALDLRTEAGIKVRQPLLKLCVKKTDLEGETDLLDLVKDEVNIKEIVFDSSLSQEAVLDTELTEELLQEGEVREFLRSVQNLRKEKHLEPGEEVELRVKTGVEGKDFLEKFENTIKEGASISALVFTEDLNSSHEISLREKTFAFDI